MMNKRNILIAVGLAATLGTGMTIAATNSCDSGHGKHRGFHKGHNVVHMIKHMGKKLDLSEQQRDSLKAIAENNKVSMKKNRSSMQQLRIDSLALDPTAADFDQQVNALADRFAELARSRATGVGGIFKEVASVLDSEQLTEMREMMAKRSEKMLKRKDSS